MVFSTQSILSSKGISLEKTVEKPVSDTSYFVEMLSMLVDESKQVNSMIYKAGIEAINEGFVGDMGKNIVKNLFKNFDIKKVLKDILNSFINLLEKVWNRFQALLLEFVNKNIVLKKYKSLFENYEDIVDYPNDRYIYTNFGLNTSFGTYKKDIDMEYSDLVVKLSSFKNYNSYEDLAGSLKDIEERLGNEFDEGGYFDIVRGNIVGIESCKKENFAAELYKFFRSGGSPINSSLRPEEVRRTANMWFNYQGNLKVINKDKSDIKTHTMSVTRNLDKLNIEDYLKESLPARDDIRVIFTHILENKFRRVLELRDIYLQVFSSKFDAVKEAYTQATQILFYIVKDKVKKEGF